MRKRVLGGKAITAADYIASARGPAPHGGILANGCAAATRCSRPRSPDHRRCRSTEVDEATTPLAAFTRAVNYLGACGLSLPAGFSQDGLPIGMQLMGAPFHEPTVVRIGRAFQAATDWHKRQPDLSGVR